MDRVGATDGKDPARCFVLMLKSRRIPIQNLTHSIVFLRLRLPNRRDVIVAEGGGTPLTQVQKMARLVLPVLEAQLKGEFRWCAYCLRLTPDVDLDRCGGCKQVGYCKPPDETDEHILKHMNPPRREALLRQIPRHKAHWKKGYKQECERFQAEAEEKKKAAEVGAAGGGGG